MFKLTITTILLCAACSSEPIGPDPTGGHGGTTEATGGNGTGGNGGSGGAPQGDGGPVSGSRIKTRTLVGDDGSHAPSGFYDSALSTNCSWSKDSEGATRCLPDGPYTNLYVDSACTLPLVVATCSKPGYVHVSTDACGGSSVHPVGGEVDSAAPVYTILGTTCVEAGPSAPGAGTRYGGGSAMDPGTFEKATEEIGQ